MLITPAQRHNSINNIFPNNTLLPTVAESVEPPPQPVVAQSVPRTKKPLRVPRKKATTDNPESLIKKRLVLETQIQESLKKRANQHLQTIEDQKDELTHRKRLLSQILKEYEQIAKDKSVLSTEIQNMKQYLAEIRIKLDQSLSILTKNTNLFAMHRHLSRRYPATQKSRRLKSRTTRNKKKRVKSNTKIRVPNSTPESNKVE